MVEHAVDMLAQFASRIVAMAKGKIIADGSPEEVFSNTELLSSMGIQIPEIPLLFHELQKAEIYDPVVIPVTVEQGFDRLRAFLQKRTSGDVL
jgi:ABC-type enterochelin transport system ATPase subunit